MEIWDIFPTAKPKNADLAEKLRGNMIASLVNSRGSDLEIGELQALKAKIEDREHIKLGNLIGAGAQALVFEILDAHDRPLEHSVLRIEDVRYAGKLDNPLAIMPLDEIFSSDTAKAETLRYVASIVLKQDASRTPQLKNMRARGNLRKTLSVYNKLSQLDELRDINETQFSYIKGISLPVITDRGSLGITPFNTDMNNIDRFIETIGFDCASVASDDLIEKLRAEASAAYATAVEELQNNGIKITIPTTQSDVTKTQISCEARGRHV
jgi:hypothetical protein